MAPPARPLLGCTIVFAAIVPSLGVAKEVIAHVQCDTCKLAMELAQSHATDHKIVEEDGLLDMVDGLCSVKKDEGKWVAKVDIVAGEDPGTLSLMRYENIGYCKSECIAVQRACQAALKGKEEIIVSLIQKGKGPEELKSKVCKKQCAKKLPNLGDWKDEPFRERDQKEVEAEERVRKMEAETGQKFKMWSREEISSMSQADIELEAAKDALGAQRREVELKAKAERGEL